jgi:hypothetical protein
MDVDLSQYISAGYYLTRYAEDGFWKSDLLPSRIVSISQCIGRSLSVDWGWRNRFEEDNKDILDFGIPETKLNDFQEWCRQHGDFFPNTFPNLTAARQFIAEFLPEHTAHLLLGIGLHDELVDSFLAEESPVSSDLNADGTYSERASTPEEFVGIYRALYQRQPLEAGGTTFGFEVVSYSYLELSHSWLCHHLEQDVSQLFGIQANAYGLIKNYADARKVYDWIAEDDQQGHRAESEPYYPVLLVSYPLT